MWGKIKGAIWDMTVDTELMPEDGQPVKPVSQAEVTPAPVLAVPKAPKPKAAEKKPNVEVNTALFAQLLADAMPPSSDLHRCVTSYNGLTEFIKDPATRWQAALSTTNADSIKMLNEVKDGIDHVEREREAYQTGLAKERDAAVQERSLEVDAAIATKNICAGRIADLEAAIAEARRDFEAAEMQVEEARQLHAAESEPYDERAEVFNVSADAVLAELSGHLKTLTKE